MSAQLRSETIFVFGSNLRGIHGAGAAATAVKQYGAVGGIGVGPMNRSYAVPTKDWNLQPLPRSHIALYIAQFANYTRLHWKHKTPYIFKITRLGCGLAGYKDNEIAPLFEGSSPNCYFDRNWEQYLGKLHSYWGTWP